MKILIADTNDFKFPHLALKEYSTLRSIQENLFLNPGTSNTHNKSEI